MATLLGSDYGNGLDFVVPEDVTLNVFIVIFSGQTVNFNFTPMIELASVATGEFETYKELQCNVDATGKIVASEYFNPISVFYGTSADTTITMTYLQTADETGATNLIATKASNAVEGHISGEIINISDISPIQHNISTHLYTKNLVIPNEATFIYPNGYTATLNDDGSVTVSGSANTTESINLSIALRKRDGTYNSIPLEAGQKYRMHFYKDGEISVRGRLKITNSSGTNFFESVTAWNQTDNLLSEDRNITNIYVDSSDQAIGDTSLCGTYRIIVEKDLSAVSVLEYGKNLVPYPFNETTKTVNGITFVDNRDGTVTATGTATADTGMYLFSTSYNPIKLSKGIYVLSGCPTGGSASTYSISVGTSTSTVAMDYGNNPVFTISEELSNTGVGVSLKIASGTTVNGLVFKPQIELGAVATEFEKYLTPKAHASSEFGVIENIPSRYPTMTLKTNVAGVIIDVEYNKDVNAEFEQLNHKPLITFIDDDCQDEQLTNWEEINKLTGVKPTIAVITNNPLDAPNNASRYTTWSNIQRLTNCGFEFISHTDTHLNLTECDSAALESELYTSLSKLQEHGINPKFLVYPYNAYNDTVIDSVRKYYKGAVTCEYQTNLAPINDFAIKRQSFTSTKQFDKTFDDGTTRTVYQFRTDDELRQMINEAAAKNGWIIFMTHLRNYDVYYYDNDIKTKLVNLIEYAKAKGLQPVSLNEGYEFMKDRREQISSSSVSYGRFIDEKEVDAKIKTVETQLDNYIAKNQGAENVGKILVVGTDGNLTLIDMPEGGASGDVTGVLDESNNILLSGNLADGTYTLKWLLDDGTYADAGTLEVGEIEKPKTNFADTTSSDWTANGRIGSDGGIRTDAVDGCFATNYIACQNGDIIVIENAEITKYNHGFYNASKTKIQSPNLDTCISNSYLTDVTTTATESQVTINVANTAYMRFSLSNVSNKDNVIINIKRNGEWL